MATLIVIEDLHSLLGSPASEISLISDGLCGMDTQLEAVEAVG